MKASMNMSGSLQVVKELLQGLQNDGLVYVRGKMLEVTMLQRLELAICALSRGQTLKR